MPARRLGCQPDDSNPSPCATSDRGCRFERRPRFTFHREALMADSDVTRRDFVATTGKAAFGAIILPRFVLGGPGYQAPSDTMNIAIAGFGGMGSTNALELAKTDNIVAVCDVDLGYSERQVTGKLNGRDGKPTPEGQKLSDQFAKAKKYNDFREMLDKEKGIDGVVIATPDHAH